MSVQRVIVVGGSSGIGEALVRQLVREGARVVVLARREAALAVLTDGLADASGEVRAIVHDVTETASVKSAFDDAVAWLGGLDVLVYSAGVMPTVEREGFDTAVDHQIMQVNLMGAVAWLNEGAAWCLQHQSGTLVGIGSVAGERGRVGNPAYCSSKAALHTFLEALRNRLDRHGVQVLTVKPGPVKTPMLEGLGPMPFEIEASEAAAGILAAVRRRAMVAYVPVVWSPIMAVIRAIPSPVFRRLDV
jgi:decaprenylphospho-beta-D-erythro-pentofuranosid-2-ulose 2-reductase